MKKLIPIVKARFVVITLTRPKMKSAHWAFTVLGKGAEDKGMKSLFDFIRFVEQNYSTQSPEIIEGYQTYMSHMTKPI